MFANKSTAASQSDQRWKGRQNIRKQNWTITRDMGNCTKTMRNTKYNSMVINMGRENGLIF